METTTRREFLVLTASLSAAVATGNAKPLYAASETVPGTVRAWRTSTLENFSPFSRRRNGKPDRSSHRYRSILTLRPHFKKSSALVALSQMHLAIS